jgi:carotenoid 1,2-hydratase
MNLLSGVREDHHRPQKNPGAYEWWNFDASDDKSGLTFSAQFYAGHLRSAHYQQALSAYWGRTKSPLLERSAPTVPNPPNPLDFTGVIFQLYKDGRTLAEFFQEFEPGTLKASDRAPAVLLGPDRFHWEEKGDPPSYVLTLQGAVGGGKTLRARLFFTPHGLPLPGAHVSETLPTHTWVLAAPLCHVEGTFQWCDEKAEVVREEAFLGKGSHDHHFGTVPLDRFVSAWHWGRAYFEDQVVLYSVQVPVDTKEQPEGTLVFLSHGKAEAVCHTQALELSRKGRNFFLLPFHRSLRFRSAPALRVEHREVLSDGPLSLLFRDAVSFEGQPEVEGLSQFLYPPRLSNPLFFPMLKGRAEIIRRSLDQDPPPPSADVTTSRPVQ